MFENTKIKEIIKIEDYLKLMKGHTEDDLYCTPHTFFRLSQKQRKIFDFNELKRILLYENPILAGIQYNGNYAVFYSYQNKNLKIILRIGNGKINIVTFYFIEKWQIPTI